MSPRYPSIHLSIHKHLGFLNHLSYLLVYVEDGSRQILLKKKVHPPCIANSFQPLIFEFSFFQSTHSLLTIFMNIDAPVYSENLPFWLLFCSTISILMKNTLWHFTLHLMPQFYPNSKRTSHLLLIDNPTLWFGGADSHLCRFTFHCKPQTTGPHHLQRTEMKSWANKVSFTSP